MRQPAQTAFFVSDQYARFDYGAAHPMRISRLPLTVEVAEAYDLLTGPGVRVLAAETAPEEDLQRFHRPEYLAELRQASAGRAGGDLFRWGLGSGDNPIFPGLYEYMALLTGATLAAGRLVERGEVRVAFNIAGGLHHAAADRASGFCYVNDAAVLIAELLSRGRRVAYVDIDAHHGDGVQFGFYDTDRVLTISIHETGETLFPGTGFPEETGKGAGKGFSANVPLAPGTDDEIFLWALEAVVPPLLKAYAPDLLITQLGIDTHRTDPLAHLALSIQGFRRAVEILRDCGLPWVALGGGGYDLANVPRAWTAAWAVMTGREVPDRLPDAARRALEQRGIRRETLSDPVAPLEDAGERAAAWRYARASVARVQELIFPRFGLTASDAAGARRTRAG
ncbi:MAG: acetoin utilization protein AcuC [candidate division NC10 bacterium]|nr:acetoin utilization protein AcuC [candidate division NC10 bacterium]